MRMFFLSGFIVIIVRLHWYVFHFLLSIILQITTFYLKIFLSFILLRKQITKDIHRIGINLICPVNPKQPFRNQNRIVDYNFLDWYL